MPREWIFRLQDIIQSAKRIMDFIRDLNYEQLEQDHKTVDAVLRNLTIIGEAATHIPQAIRDKHPHVPWDEMRRMRNIVVHEYFGVSLSVVWQTSREDIPPLVPQLQAILDSNG